MTQDLAAEAVRHWPMVTGVPELVMQRENTVYRVATTAGPHALRLHREGYHSDAALRSELDWMAMLARAGMEVPVPAMAQGVYLVTLIGGRRASLLSWLPGQPMGAAGLPLALEGAARGALFCSLGGQMARMHLLSDGWALPDGFERPAWDLDGLVGEAPFWGRFWEVKADPDDVALLVAARDRLRAALLRYQAMGADYGLIHADLVRENVLVDGAQLRFIDFDDCGFGFRVFDLATVLLKTTQEPDFGALQAALLDGYGQVRPLLRRDLAMLPVFMALRSLTYIGWAMARWQDAGMGERAARFLAVAKRVLAQV